MRELPEIEVLRRDLERELAGKKLTAVEVANRKVLASGTTPAALGALAGAKLGPVGRRGALLLVGVDEQLLVLRLGPDANLRLVAAKAPAKKKAKGAADEELPPAGVVTLGLGPAGEIRLVDPGAGSTVWLTTPDGLAEAVPEVVTYGPDALDEPETWMRFAARFTSRRAPARTVLTDPTFAPGVGDLYADEILFEAGIRPDRVSNTLGAQELRRLSRAVSEVLHDAVKHRGTSTGGHPFTLLSGATGEHQSSLAVWGRDGKRSPRSHHTIRKMKLDGRWTYFCETQV